ncbi:MAG: glycosyltransferase family 39 protein [Armatimonadota bacterium]|nr:glycosyltransferase family 39 protein [Armatimonadota bacterium]
MRPLLAGRPAFLISLALGLCALYALYFLRIGAYPLFDPDEPVYGQVAREMIGGADWLTPRLNGAPWFDKPPLFYWLAAFSMSLFGPTEFACRLPSALAAVGLIALVYALAARDFGRRAAVISAIVMATCLQQVVLARAAVTDMTFAFFLTAALYCYRRWLDEQLDEARDETAADGSTKSSTATQNAWAAWAVARGGAWAVACGGATGLAMLTKGPVAPLLLSVAFVLHLRWLGRLRHLRSGSAALAVATALLVGLPWYAAMYRRHGQDFVQGFLVANNITRFLKAEHGAQTGHWYAIFLNVPVLLIFFFPWSVFLPQAVARLWRAQGRNSIVLDSIPHEPSTTGSSTVGARLALVWFGVVFIFFSLSKTQLVTYTFPLYPVAAILVGVLWNEAESDAAVWRVVRRELWAMLLLAALLTVGLTLTMHKKHSEAQTAVLAAGAIGLAACGLALWLPGRRDRRTESYKGRVSSAAWALASGVTCVTLWLLLNVMPLVLAGESTRDLVLRLPPRTAQVATYRTQLPSLLFYLALRPQNRYVGALDIVQMRRLTREHTPFFIVCRRDAESVVTALGARPWARSGKLVVLANGAAMTLPEAAMIAPRKDIHAS